MAGVLIGGPHDGEDAYDNTNPTQIHPRTVNITKAGMSIATDDFNVQSVYARNGEGNYDYAGKFMARCDGSNKICT